MSATSFTARKLFAGAPQPAKQPTAVPQPIFTLKALRRERGDIETLILPKFDTYSVFDADDSKLARAWERKDIPEIEHLLKTGDQLTRNSWQYRIRIFNAVVMCIDLARDKLKHLLAESEAALAPYNIDMSSIDVSRSKSLEGVVAIATRKKFVTETANYNTTAGLALSKVFTGQLPWQAAAIFAAGVAIWHFINREKAFRLLKEMQGKLMANAEAAKGDFGMMRALIITRMVPQFDGLIETCEHLETGLGELREMEANGGTDARDRAFRLARSLIEGKRFLEMMAGD